MYRDPRLRLRAGLSVAFLRSEDCLTTADRGLREPFTKIRNVVFLTSVTGSLKVTVRLPERLTRVAGLPASTDGRVPSTTNRCHGEAFMSTPALFMLTTRHSYSPSPTVAPGAQARPGVRMASASPVAPTRRRS